MTLLSTPNFHLEEWATNEYNMIYPCKEKVKLFEGLEIYKKELAEEYDVDISNIACIITSGDRLYTDGDSQHEQGTAGDVHTKINGQPLTTQKQMKVIERLNIFTGRGMYLADDDDGIIHVDVRRGLYPEKTGNRISRWYRDEDKEYHVWNKDYHDKPFDGHLEVA